MKNLANFLLFQFGWFACVYPAKAGHMWFGSLFVLTIVIAHLAFLVEPQERLRQALFILLVGAVGAGLDSWLGAIGATQYPTSEGVWTYTSAPPWIVALWVLFATLPHHSLAWLSSRPWLAVLLGGIGGPLSYFAGTRVGAVAVGENQWLTWGALALEYAIVTPVLLCLARPTAHLSPVLAEGADSADI